MNTTAPVPLLALEGLATSGSSSRWRRLGRLARRSAGFSLLIVRALFDYARSVWLVGRHGDVAAKSGWLAHWSRQALELLEIRLQTKGHAPANGGILVANHLSYLDVVVMSALHPCVFVAKSEVRSWPVFGLMARLAGTLFIDRETRLDVARLNADLSHCVQRGALVVLFPEGTSTDGQTVLPFHCALLEPAASHNWPATPAWLGYSRPDGSADREACYWGRAVFLSHFLELLTKETVIARIHFGAAITGEHRKRLGRRLHEAVVALAPTDSRPELRPPGQRRDKPWLAPHEAAAQPG